MATASRYRRARRPLAGRRVLVTGAASGIGEIMAREAARRGASHVVIWDRDEHGAERVARTITARGHRACAWEVDLTDAEAVERAGRAVTEAIGGIDVLINCAGVVTGKAVLDVGEDDLERVYGVNVFALYRTARAFLPGMLERDDGLIVTIASAAGLVGVARQTDYSASKFAAVGFSEALRAELRHAGSAVTTLTVMPYYIDTGMFAGVRTRFPRLLPVLEPADVARRVLDQIEAGAATVALPRFARAVQLVKVVTPVHDILTDIFGINATMDHFTGRVRRADADTTTPGV
ncbi:SDR family oxidoreductase [Nanchangia anserum]|uniref:SDR family oxidoreductase n=2 Tax=Nanchangia anserum TaxID=2692125 RepID=A0A8I0GCE8_9ACTO|nr:SDR family oxidoreductase [Nanchangia anserum]QOX82537.1 SDR family oxidoreductase [Nanchangia anserum]